MSDDGEKKPAGVKYEVDAPSVAGSDVAATFANKFTITVGEVTTRIAFAEQVGKGELNYHTAVVLLTSDVRQMRDVLTGLLKIMDQEIAKAKAKAAPDVGRT